MRIAQDVEDFQGGEKVGNGSGLEDESYWEPTSGEVTLSEDNRYNPSQSGVVERSEANHPGRSGVDERSEANHPGRSEAARVWETAVPRKPDFSLNVEQIVEVVKQEKPKCIFLTSPNNPDGSIIDDDVLLKILDLPILVILDEAYIEFSAIESRMSWVKKHENLIVLRTFSKRAGLAGLRVGYGAFPLSIIEYLW
ncbi:histidinol-phosphate aminotransferase, chloroplastic-like, partial [Vigna umbellata]|uniref:histidinol-phosphate aminotransferase, chloroplastic-like n=1 Tax=Vigna umbellata TaxID=87088 RepID=UPI001F5F5311